MAADRIAKISPLVREVFESPSDGMCATFEIAGNSDAWAQVMKATINAAYPLETAPDGPLREILAALPGAVISDWQAKQHVTLMFDDANPGDVATAVDRLLSKLHGAADYSVEGRLEEL